MLERLKDNLQLTVISLFAALTVLAITPFAVYRFANGQFAVGAINSVIVISICAATVHSWRGGNSDRAGLLMAVVTSLSCILVSVMFARHGLLWAYVVYTTNFMLTQRRYALLLNLSLLLTLGLHPAVFEQGLERGVFFATSILVSLCAFVFAHHMASQRHQLLTLASHDALTGAHNRLAMESDLVLAVETHRRSATPCGIAMLDLDNFKQVNDRFGHDQGDRVLVEFTRIARDACRKRDRLYRFGGEEFVMLLPSTAEDGVRAALDKLRRAVEAELKDPEGNPVTVSAGAALLRGEREWGEWLARADSALYRAKGSGRNRVVLDSDPPGDREPSGLERRHPAR